MFMELIFLRKKLLFVATRPEVPMPKLGAIRRSTLVRTQLTLKPISSANAGARPRRGVRPAWWTSVKTTARQARE